MYHRALRAARKPSDRQVLSSTRPDIPELETSGAPCRQVAIGLYGEGTAELLRAQAGRHLTAACRGSTDALMFLGFPQPLEVQNGTAKAFE